MHCWVLQGLMGLSPRGQLQFDSVSSSDLGETIHDGVSTLLCEAPTLGKWPQHRHCLLLISLLDGQMPPAGHTNDSSGGVYLRNVS